MSKFLHNFVKPLLMLSILFGCASAQANGPQISFGGYYFSVESNPTFIGAAASDSLILKFDEDARLSFVFNRQKQFTNVALKEFLEMVYGDGTPIDDKTKHIKFEISKGMLTRKLTHRDKLIIYNIVYHDKEKIIIAHKDRMDSWVEIECKNINTSELLANIKTI